MGEARLCFALDFEVLAVQLVERYTTEGMARIVGNRFWWIAACPACFVAGVWLAPILRSAEHPLSTLAKNQLATCAEPDPSLRVGLERVERRLLALDVSLRSIQSEQQRTAEAVSGTKASVDETVKAREVGEAHDPDWRARVERLDQAPPAREILDQALRQGALGPDDITAFHHRLDELPSEAQPPLLKELQSAINQGKIQLRPPQRL